MCAHYSPRPQERDLLGPVHRQHFFRTPFGFIPLIWSVLPTMYKTLATGRIFGLSGFHTFIPLHGSSAPPPQPPSPIRHNEQRLRLHCCRRCRRRYNLRHRRRCHYHRRTAAFAFAATFSARYLVDCCLFPPAGAVAAVVFIVAAVVVTMPLVRERTLVNISTVGIRSCFYVGGVGITLRASPL